MADWLEKNKINLFVSLVLIAGFLVRIFFVNKVIVGDLLVYEEWGRKLFQLGPMTFYYEGFWVYSAPNYPPFAQWVFAGLACLYNKRFVLAQLHNLIKFPPAAFIVYFYDWGNILLMKLPSIVCDLGMAYVVYSLIIKLTGSIKRGLIGLCFYLFNPLTVFMSGAWGQTDSVVGLLGILSFLILINKGPLLSIPLMFLSLYFKFSWAVLLPLYIFILFQTKPRIAHIIMGILISLILYVITTSPFADKNVYLFGWRLFWDRYPIHLGMIDKASVSAFNFQTIFWKVDVDFSDSRLLGLTSGNLGVLFYMITNIIAMINFRNQKNKTTAAISGIFMVGMGSFMFLATMLERYFFPAYAPMIILAFSNPKLLLNMLTVNLLLIINIVYSFYRRGSDELYRFFTDNNHLLIRMISLAQVFLFATFTRSLMLQSKSERSD
jgi:Gpi18-like mannosyltransferase